MIELGGRAMYEAEALFWVLLEMLGNGHEELVLGKQVLRYQRTGTSRAAHSLRRGADDNDLVELLVWELWDGMFEEVVCCRNAAIRATNDDNVLSQDRSVACHFVYVKVRLRTLIFAIDNSRNKYQGVRSA